MKVLKSLTAALVGATALVSTGTAALADGHLKEITVAYFLEWPTPNQFAQTNKMYEEALGVKVNLLSSLGVMFYFLYKQSIKE